MTLNWTTLLQASCMLPHGKIIQIQNPLKKGEQFNLRWNYSAGSDRNGSSCLAWYCKW